MSGSSTPVGCDILAAVSWMTKTALHRMASASVACAAIASTPARLRRSSSNLGMDNSMEAPSTGLELGCRIDAHGAPGRIEGCKQGGDDRQRDLDAHVRGTEADEPEDVAGEERVRTRQSKVSQQQSGDTSCKTHCGCLGKILRQDRAAIGADCSARDRK